MLTILPVSGEVRIVPLVDLVARGPQPARHLILAVALQIALHGLWGPLAVSSEGDGYVVEIGTYWHALQYLVDHGTYVADPMVGMSGLAADVYRMVPVKVF